MAYNAVSTPARPEARLSVVEGAFRAPGADWVTSNEAAEANRMTASLAGLAMALLLVVAGLFLIQHLREKAQVEDCLMSGRLNCDAVLVAPLR